MTRSIDADDLKNKFWLISRRLKRGFEISGISTVRRFMARWIFAMRRIKFRLWI